MRPAPEATDPCPLCEGRGWVIEEDGAAGTARPCDCQAEGRPAERLRRAGIPERYRDCRLSNFETSAPDPRDQEQLERARAACERYVDAFLSSDGDFSSSGLLLIGRPGTGKSHLAAAVLAELIWRYGVDGRFVDFTTLVHDIQSTFDQQSMASKHQILDPVMNARVLVLDELAAQKPSAWVNDTLYLIMNGRYTRKLPTLFTTNYPLEAASGRAGVDEPTLASRIPARLVSRLHQMATPIAIEAGDFRREVKVHSRRS